MNINYKEKLRLITPIGLALCLFILNSIRSDIVDISKNVNTLRERMSGVEAQVKIILRDM